MPIPAPLPLPEPDPELAPGAVPWLPWPLPRLALEPLPQLPAIQASVSALPFRPPAAQPAGFAANGDVDALQGVAGCVNSCSGRGERVGRRAILDDQLGLHYLARPAGHDELHVAQVRVADPSLDGWPARCLVGVDGLDDLGHESVGGRGQVGGRWGRRDQIRPHGRGAWRPRPPGRTRPRPPAIDWAAAVWTVDGACVAADADGAWAVRGGSVAVVVPRSAPELAGARDPPNPMCPRRPRPEADGPPTARTGPAPPALGFGASCRTPVESRACGLLARRHGDQARGTGSLGRGDGRRSHGSGSRGGGRFILGRRSHRGGGCGRGGRGIGPVPAGALARMDAPAGAAVVAAAAEAPPRDAGSVAARSAGAAEAASKAGTGAAVVVAAAAVVVVAAAEAGAAAAIWDGPASRAASAQTGTGDVAPGPTSAWPSPVESAPTVWPSCASG